ncbi:MAG: hypothetical protein COV91_02985 [Candidatus Taylorbacteria bacterium CG11_big_fil_rev_8_21_14_0_20_46_11]|uniref:M23ase beta-sheet core domain-containing protein n=1 Tax=Candidatus Taylorbacteria bacterium CG11_big_fil_rev_8_21_14_0_20_46_11 TaxID=1975025 RepID=A0A2H0KBL1_9BACT|nr:MAG: hypothetical protein COV91_02985 [Candidatus Taylorbacteria bacterium CG11_big_fil_rev_8_21_14_0_20_46_11]
MYHFSRFIYICGLGFLFCVTSVYATSIGVTPAEFMQGDPARITIEGVSRDDIDSLSWGNTPLPLFEYEGKVSSIVGVDLSTRPGLSVLTLRLVDGTVITKQVRVGSRKRTTAPLGIPDKMGGNTPTAESNLMKMFVQENAILAQLTSTTTPLWHDSFQYPLSDTRVSDSFGYVRQTGASTIFHRGTDFEADIGTPVYALSDGVVRLMRQFTAYGKIIVVDYGSNISAYYLHLSQMNVRKDELVEKGQVIGLSGDTGYALSPHLHLSIKIHGASIDPMKFFTLLGPR